MHNEVLGYESLTQGIPWNAIRFPNRKQGELLCSLLVLNVIMLLSEFSKGHLPLTSLNFFYPMEMSALILSVFQFFLNNSEKSL